MCSRCFADVRLCDPFRGGGPSRMSDFSFMRSGFDLVDGGGAGPDVDTLRMIVSLMMILSEEAAKSGARFARACGRRTVVGRDIIAALKYEAHFFWEKDFDARFVERLQEERAHTYETDDESSEGERESDEDEAEEEPYTRDLQASSAEEGVFHAAVCRVEREWADWQPDDVAKILLKSAIDKTERQVASEEMSG